MTVSKAAREIADQFPPVPKEPPKNVVEALSRVMSELPAIGKDTKGDNLPYKYRSIEDMTGAVQPLFGKYGVVMVPHVLESETRDLVINGKPWTDTVLTVDYNVYGPGGKEDWIVLGPFVGIGRDNSDKGANKALTQAFKYALLQLLCISDSRDDGDNEVHEADALPPRTPKAIAMEGLVEVINDFGVDDDDEERQKLKAYLRDRFGPPSEMAIADIYRATDIAAGWPETAKP